VSKDEYALEWRALANKGEASPLTQFQCTQPWPTTPGGRRLPAHPREWEHDAQKHVRNLRQLMRPGDRVLVGVDNATDSAVVAAVLHLRFQRRDDSLVVVFEVGAVATSHRSSEPPFLGDEMMAVAEAESRAALTESGCAGFTLAGFIHSENKASMRMASRNGWEPLGGPGDTGYLPWRKVIAR
jgi:hypothetical protein